MEVHASLRRLRMSPRKVRLVVDLVRGLPVRDAEIRLSFLDKAASRPVLKLLKSAVANAEHNFKLDPSALVIRTIAADEGPTYKRFRPRAFGRAGAIRKRTTHVTITLAAPEKKSEAKAPRATKRGKGKTAAKPVAKAAKSET